MASRSTSVICAIKPLNSSLLRPWVMTRVPWLRITFAGCSPMTSRPLANLVSNLACNCPAADSSPAAESPTATAAARWSWRICTRVRPASSKSETSNSQTSLVLCTPKPCSWGSEASKRSDLKRSFNSCELSAGDPPAREGAAVHAFGEHTAVYRFCWSLKPKIWALCPFSSGWLSIPTRLTLHCCVRFAGRRDSVVSLSTSTSYRSLPWSKPLILPVLPLCSCAFARPRTTTEVPIGIAYAGGGGAEARPPLPRPLPIMPGKPPMPPMPPMSKGMPPMPPGPPWKTTRGPPMPPPPNIPPGPPPPSSPKNIEKGSLPPKNALKMSSACWKETPSLPPPPCPALAFPNRS
mmetsp:Transcript_173686/g.551417  ORF Transcript_173686/g.551417 Transcript_173686/m.551417 type:complete len:350 (+) Transcript_173686:334-1383(+)